MKTTNANLAYKTIYKDDGTAEWLSLRSMREQLEKQFDDAKRAEQKRQQPKAKKRFKPLPDEVAVQIRDEILASPMFQECGRLEAAHKIWLQRRERLLDKLAPKVDFKPTYATHRVAVSYSTTYATQGWGSMTYARGALLPWADHLERTGFEVYIRPTNYRRGTGTFAVDHCDYELWATCEPWMFDAAKRTLSLEDGVASLKQRAINPLVFNPFLGPSCRL